VHNTAADCVVIFQEPAVLRDFKNQVFSLAKEYLAVVVTKKDDSNVTLYQVNFQVSGRNALTSNLFCYFIFQQMESELERFHKQNTSLELNITELRLKLKATDKEMHSQRQRVNKITDHHCSFFIRSFLSVFYH